MRDAKGAAPRAGLPHRADRLAVRAASFALSRPSQWTDAERGRALRRTLNATSHRLVLGHLRRRHASLIADYRSAPAPAGPRPPGPRIAWVAWWQGERHAPALVRLCLAGLRRNLPGVDLRVVTEANFRDYSDLSPVLVDRLRRGQLSLTQFSDALRMNLLRRHGGLWVDATILTPEPVPADVFERPFYSRRAAPHPDGRFASADRWAGFLIGGAPGNPAFAFVDDLIEEFWSRNRAAVNYFLIDYALAIAYEEDIGGFAAAVDALPENNPDLYAIVDRLADPLDLAFYRSVTPPASPTWFHKLNRRLPVVESVGGAPTLYGYLRERCG